MQITCLNCFEDVEVHNAIISDEFMNQFSTREALLNLARNCVENKKSESITRWARYCGCDVEITLKFTGDK